MKFSAAVLAAYVFGIASAQSTATTTTEGFQKPSEAPRPNAITAHGCYNQTSTSWKKFPVKNMSMGSCTAECQTNQKMNVAALNGDDCYCGNEYPPKNAVVPDSNCNYPCPYYPEEACGGIDPMLYYSVYNTGLKVIVPDQQPASTSASATPTSTSPAVETVIETPTESAQPTRESDNKKGGTNVAGVAAGVVVGVVVIAAIVGGVFFYFRRKRNLEIEEEHRRNAAVNAFIGGAKPPSSSGVSMTDSRMDPTLAHRRMSDGSIADNQDYSRKILRVTNA